MGHGVWGKGRRKLIEKGKTAVSGGHNADPILLLLKNLGLSRNGHKVVPLSFINARMHSRLSSDIDHSYSYFWKLKQVLSAMVLRYPPDHQEFLCPLLSTVYLPSLSTLDLH